MLAKLPGQRYIPTDKEEAFSQLWQIAENHRAAINDLVELCDATVTTKNIIDMVKPLAREAFIFQLPIVFDKENFTVGLRSGIFLPYNAKELEDAWKAAYANYYVEYTFTGDKLTAIDIWTTAAKTLKLFGRAFTWTGENLTSHVTTRISDGATLTKTLTYSGGNLATLTAAVA